MQNTSFLNTIKPDELSKIVIEDLTLKSSDAGHYRVTIKQGDTNETVKAEVVFKDLFNIAERLAGQANSLKDLDMIRAFVGRLKKINAQSRQDPDAHAEEDGFGLTAISQLGNIINGSSSSPEQRLKKLEESIDDKRLGPLFASIPQELHNMCLSKINLEEFPEAFLNMLGIWCPSTRDTLAHFDGVDPETLAKWINENEIPVWKLKLGDYDLKKVLPLLTYLDISQLNSESLAILLNLDLTKVNSLAVNCRDLAFLNRGIFINPSRFPNLRSLTIVQGSVALTTITSFLNLNTLNIVGTLVARENPHIFGALVLREPVTKLSHLKQVQIVNFPTQETCLSIESISPIAPTISEIDLIELDTCKLKIETLKLLQYLDLTKVNSLKINKTTRQYLDCTKFNNKIKFSNLKTLIIEEDDNVPLEFIANFSNIINLKIVNIKITNPNQAPYFPKLFNLKQLEIINCDAKTVSAIQLISPVAPNYF